MEPDKILIDFLVDGRDGFLEDLNIDVDLVNSRLTLNELLRDLALCSIVSWPGEEITRIHRPVQMVLRDYSSEEETNKLVKRVGNIAVTALRNCDRRGSIFISAAADCVYGHGDTPPGALTFQLRSFFPIYIVRKYNTITRTTNPSDIATGLCRLARIEAEFGLAETPEARNLGEK